MNIPVVQKSSIDFILPLTYHIMKTWNSARAVVFILYLFFNIEGHTHKWKAYMSATHLDILVCMTFDVGTRKTVLFQFHLSSFFKAL